MKYCLVRDGLGYHVVRYDSKGPWLEEYPIWGGKTSWRVAYGEWYDNPPEGIDEAIPLDLHEWTTIEIKEYESG